MDYLIDNVLFRNAALKQSRRRRQWYRKRAIRNKNMHTHGTNPCIVSSFMAEQKLKTLARKIQDNALTVYARTVQGLSLPETAFLPCSSSLGRIVSK